MIRLLLPACALLCLGLAHAADERFPYACTDGTHFEAAFPTDSEGVTTAIVFCFGFAAQPAPRERTASTARAAASHL